MARPREYDQPRVSTALRLPSDLHARLRAAATEREVSVNLMVERACIDYLARLTPVADLLATRNP